MSTPAPVDFMYLPLLKCRYKFVLDKKKIQKYQLNLEDAKRAKSYLPTSVENKKLAPFIGINFYS